MIQLKSMVELAHIRNSCRLLSDTLKDLKTRIVPGVTTEELDLAARQQVESGGGIPAFLGYRGYPASLCTAINEEVIHGIPGKRTLQEGDIIGLDMGVNLGGYVSDAAVSVAVGNISGARNRLLSVAKECLYYAIEQAVSGNRISDIAQAVFSHAQRHGLDVVRQFCGHGVGFALHEDPQVPNYPGNGPNPRLKPGMVLAIEPMINEGTWEVRILDNDWTVVTEDGSDSAHFEHTVAVLDGRTETLTSWE